MPLIPIALLKEPAVQWEPGRPVPACVSWANSENLWSEGGLLVDAVRLRSGGGTEIACRTYHLSMFKALTTESMAAEVFKSKYILGGGVFSEVMMKLCTRGVASADDSIRRASSYRTRCDIKESTPGGLYGIHHPQRVGPTSESYLPFCMADRSIWDDGVSRWLPCMVTAKVILSHAERCLLSMGSKFSCTPVPQRYFFLQYGAESWASLVFIATLMAAFVIPAIKWHMTVSGRRRAKHSPTHYSHRSSSYRGLRSGERSRYTLLFRIVHHP